MSSLASRLLLLALTLGSPACAGRTRPVAAPSPGALVRVTESCRPRRADQPCPRYRGELVQLDRDSVRLRAAPDSLVRALAATDVARLEVLTGRPRAVLPGLGIGMVVGFAVGGLADQSACSDYRGSWPCIPSGAGYGALAGAVVGGVVGGLIRFERWARVAWP